MAVSVEDVLSRTRAFFHDDINQLHVTNDEYTTTYTMVYRACTQRPPDNHSGALYNFVRSGFAAAAASIDVTSADDVGQAWASWVRRVRLIDLHFKYLDRFYTKRLGLADIAELGAEAFASGLVRTMQPTRLLKTGVQISPAALTLPPDETFEQQVAGLKVAELRQALVARGDDAVGMKLSLQQRLLDLMRADAVAARYRLLHPLVDALAPAAAHNVDVRPLIITEILKQKERIARLFDRLRRHALFLERFVRSLQLWYNDIHFRPGGSVGFYGHVQQRAGASAHAEAAAADRFPHTTQEEADEEHEQIVKRARAA